MPESKDRSTYLVTAVAASRGATAAYQLASSLAGSGGRDTVLVSASMELVKLRRYDVARAVLAQAQATGNRAAYADMVNHLQPVALDKLDPADPMTPVIEEAMFEMGARLAGRPWNALLGKQLENERTRVASSGDTWWRTLPQAVREDIIVSFRKSSVDGNRTDGWRVTFGSGSNRVMRYVISEHGQARLVGGSGLETGVGRHILDLLAHGNARTAGTWTRWLTEDLEVHQASSRPYTDLVAWLRAEEATAGSTVLPREVSEVLAAALVTDDAPELAAPILRRCAPKAAAAKKSCRAFLALALSGQQRWDELAAVEHQIVEQDAGGVEPLARQAYALARAGKMTQATALIDDALTRMPDDLLLLRTRVELAVAAGRPDEVRTWQDKLLASPRADARDENDVAWNALFFGFDLAQARDIAARAERGVQTAPRALANTIAAIEAERGHLGEAWRYELQSIVPGQAPRSDDWYVIGRIAEGYGLRDDAIAAYRKVTRPKLGTLLRTGYELAQRGLARLGAH